MRKIIYSLLFIFSLLLISGCATAPVVKLPAPMAVPGIYHRVEKGQTLWRISKMYDLDLDEIVSINRISDATKIESGQMIFIPNRSKQVETPAALTGDDFIWPLKGKVISSFGSISRNMINKGIDIASGTDSEVVASRSGKIVFYSDNFGLFGRTLIIDHGNGFSTVYAGCSKIIAKLGNNVQKGELIAKAGASGNNIFLHFEIRKGHIPQNPYYYLP